MLTKMTAAAGQDRAVQEPAFACAASFAASIWSPGTHAMSRAPFWNSFHCVGMSMIGMWTLSTYPAVSSSQ